MLSKPTQENPFEPSEERIASDQDTSGSSLPHAKRRRLIDGSPMKKSSEPRSSRVTVHSNGKSSTSPSPSALTSRGYRRDQLVRIISQELSSLGLKKTLEALELESGINIHEQSIVDFQNNILNGKWARVLTQLPNVQLRPHADMNEVKFLILEQKFLELIDAGDVRGALNCMRTELTPLECCASRLHQLALVLTCPGTYARRQPGEGSRHQLLNRLKDFIPATVLVPEDRLETLLDLAIQKQVDNCLYHNPDGFDFREKDLLDDHKCSNDAIPRKCIHVLEAHEDEVWIVEFSRDGSLLATSSKDGVVVIWRVSKQFKLLNRIIAHDGSVLSIAFSPSGDHYVTTGADSALKLWDTKTGQMLMKRIVRGEAVTCVSWLPDGKRFVFGSNTDLVILDMDGNDDHVWPSMPIQDLRVSADGTLLVAVPYDQNLLLFDLECPSDPEKIPMDSLLLSVDLSRDDKFATVVCQGTKEILVIDLQNRKVASRLLGLTQSRYVIRAVFGGLGDKFICSGSEDSSIYIWNRKSGSLIETLTGHSGTVGAVSWNPKVPGMLASGSDDHTVRIWGSDLTRR